MTGWAVVIAQPMQERRALINLAQQGFECYAPRVIQSVRRNVGRVSKLVKSPQYLFGRYFFVRVIDQWKSINSTRGVQSLLVDVHSTRPMTLHEADIARLKAREDKNGFIQLRCGKNALDFFAGDKVRVTEGQFIGLSAVFEAATQNDRVAVLLSLMGRQVRVEMEASDIAHS